MKVQTTIVYDYNERAFNEGKQFIVHQGGSRSGKTYNNIIWVLMLLRRNTGLVCDITRKTMPSIKTSVFMDFLDVMIKFDWFDPSKLNKSDMTYEFFGNTIRFISMDDPQKKRGAKRDILFMNEANEFTYEDFKQLNMRTSMLVLMDYNPSDEYHWIYERIIPLPDTAFYKTTFMDNAFLGSRERNEILRYRETDENYWRIYGLGERGVSQTTIYTNWNYTDDEEPKGEVFYGLDFGFNDPTALIKVVICDGYIWVKELLYKTQLVVPDIINIMRSLNINETETIYADNARPENIQEIYQAGFNIHPCSKGKGSIKSGIDWIKRHKVKVTKDSINLVKELKGYKWKIDKNEKILDEPVDINNHLLDAMRYAFTARISGSEQWEVIDDFIL